MSDVDELADEPRGRGEIDRRGCSRCWPVSSFGVAARGALDQHGAARVPTMFAGRCRCGLGVDARLQALQARSFTSLRRVVVQVRGRRARAARVDERELCRSRSSSISFMRLLEIFVGLAGEADDEVRGSADVRADGAQLADHRLEFQRGVAALHRRQHAVAAGLHRQVQEDSSLGTSRRRRSALREFLGVRGGEADAARPQGSRRWYGSAGRRVGELTRHHSGPRYALTFWPSSVDSRARPGAASSRHFDQHVLERAR